MSKILDHQLGLNHKDGDLVQADGAGDLAVQERRTEILPPSKYQVIMLNDDFTPMEFVVEILEKYFHMSREQATQVMLTVHSKGRAICGVFTRDIAETKAFQVIRYARENQHPLMCEIEKVSN